MKSDFEKLAGAMSKLRIEVTKCIAPPIERILNAINRAMNMLIVKCGGTHPVRSVQVVLDYPKPGPRVSRFTGIAKMRRAAKQRKAAK